MRKLKENWDESCMKSYMKQEITRSEAAKVAGGAESGFSGAVLYEYETNF